jgi:hypothetical protein
LQSSPTAASAPATTLNFLGVGKGFPGFTVNSAPPDTNGAVGATQYVQWVNSSFAVFSKSNGAVVYGPAAGNTLWSGFGGACQSDNDGDPIAQYDKAAQRWVMTQFAVAAGPPYFQCLAVSTTSDATGTYNRYSFSFATFPDYPKLGVWPDAYYLSFNMFASGTGPFDGADACAFDRAGMLTGAAAKPAQCFQQGTSVASLLPSDLDGANPPPAGSPAYFVNIPNATTASSLGLWKFHTDWTTPANSTFTGPATITVASFTQACQGGTCIPQSGTTTQLDSLADRLMYRLAYRNFGDHEALVVNHSVVAGATSGVRWYEIRSPGTVPTVYQSGTYAPSDGKWRWMGSVAMDAVGDMAVGYSKSSSTAFPSINYTGRSSTDSLGTLETEATLFAGPGSQTRRLTRWGDYSAMSIDPVDDCTFWYTNQYLPANGSFNWSTRIGDFKFSGCHATITAPSTVSAGSSTTASWSGISSPTATDWIALYSPGAPNSNVLAWEYTNGAASGSLPFAIPASLASGTYELRLYSHDSYTLLATSSPITVQGATVSASPSTVSAGSSTTASWSGISSPTATDWIALYSPGAPNSNVLAWEYTNGAASGSLPFAIPASLASGTYELRLYSHDSYTLLATSSPITVP